MAEPGSPLDRFLDELEAPAPAPSGGTAAATAAAMAAALVVMVARGTPTWEAAPGIAAQARRLRERLQLLGDEDTRAYRAVLDAMRDVPGRTPEQRDFALGRALIAAAEVPLRIADAAADVAELAALAEAAGKHTLRPDATAAATLAEAAVRASAHLVDVNLSTVPAGEHSGRAARLAAAAEAARSRALGDP